ncbi:MAG TPA: TlpA disulfide reductase family protein [Aquabacterium sp.]|nr:TlpA disulfide reductase family protein [Aquabacterium sp.]HQC98252.1 TlpA disulfide reductase family protein [Aquabacterium sp.]
MNRRQVLVGGVGIAAAIGGAGVAWRRQPAPGPATPEIAADDPAVLALWDLRLDRPEGGELALATLRGKPLVLNFWATWCPPCLREMPALDRFHRAFSPKGWQVLGIAIDGPTPVRNWLAKTPVGFPIGLGGLDGTELVRSLGNPQGGLPFTVLVGANGRVLQRKLGETSFDELAGWAGRA